MLNITTESAALFVANTLSENKEFCRIANSFSEEYGYSELTDAESVAEFLAIAYADIDAPEGLSDGFDFMLILLTDAIENDIHSEHAISSFATIFTEDAISRFKYVTAPSFVAKVLIPVFAKKQQEEQDILVLSETESNDNHMMLELLKQMGGYKEPAEPDTPESTD